MWWRKNREEIPSVPEKEPEAKEVTKEVITEVWYRNIPDTNDASVRVEGNNITLYCGNGYCRNFISTNKKELLAIIGLLNEEGVI